MLIGSPLIMIWLLYIFKELTEYSPIIDFCSQIEQCESPLCGPPSSSELTQTYYMTVIVILRLRMHT